MKIVETMPEMLPRIFPDSIAWEGGENFQMRLTGFQTRRSSLGVVAMSLMPALMAKVADKDDPVEEPAAKPVTTQRAKLEASIRTFLETIRSLPAEKRLAALNVQMESPAYTNEYKQLLREQFDAFEEETSRKQQKKSSWKEKGLLMKKSDTINNNENKLLNQSKKLWFHLPNKTPAWVGRFLFQHKTEIYFDIAAMPVANPRTPTKPIPTTSEL